MNYKKTACMMNFKCQILHIAIYFLVIFPAGIPFICWAVFRTDQQMREDMLHQARLVADAVDLDRVQALSGTKTDNRVVAPRQNRPDQKGNKSLESRFGKCYRKTHD